MDALSKTEYSKEELKLFVNRLNRIEGQIKGIKRMLENNTCSPDVLLQVSAINSAVYSFERALLLKHFESDVVKDIKDCNKESVKVFENTLKHILK